MNNPLPFQRKCAVSSLEDSRKLAESVALRLRCGDVVTVAGDLGVGKTTFAQSLISAISPVEVEVTSPTFTLLHTYDVRLADGTACEFYHYDLYRVEAAHELRELDLEDTQGRITLIEWPERLFGLRLPVTLALHITLEDNGARYVFIEGPA